jgi:hypothetical protein
MYDILSITNSTLVTADMILLCTKNCTYFMVLILLAIEKCIFSCRLGAPTLPSDLLHNRPRAC